MAHRPGLHSVGRWQLGAALLVMQISALACAVVSDRAAVSSRPCGRSREHGAHRMPLLTLQERAFVFALRAVRGGSDSEEDADGMADSNSELAGFSEADKTLSKAEQLYRSAVTGRSGQRPAAGSVDGSWSSCLKAVTNLIFTGRQAE